ncbi:hypothetical protein DRW03_08125 [Corallococcus sp. H22C18031201]|nr:hypothetical protein DRW03_08125 [Corallococcus sp. H22C18031201]
MMRGRGLWALGLTSGLLAAGCDKTPEEPAFDYGVKAPMVRRLREELAQAPCDKAKALAYAQLIFTLKNLAQTSRVSDAFIAQCGEHVALRQLSYTAHSQLEEHELALRDATALVNAQPKNANYRVWRGMSHSARGENGPAAEDFQEAFLLQPAAAQVRKQLVMAYLKLEKPCVTLSAFRRAVAARPEAAQSAEVQDGIKGLGDELSCPPEAVAAPAKP